MKMEIITQIPANSNTFESQVRAGKKTNEANRKIIRKQLTYLSVYILTLAIDICTFHCGTCERAYLGNGNRFSVDKYG